MNDLDRISTRQLNRLRRRILRVYGTARREMTEQLTEFLEHYQKLDAYKRAQLEAGKIIFRPTTVASRDVELEACKTSLGF